MLFSELRASAYKIAAAVFGVLAVALLIACLFLQVRATRANVRADAESARADKSEARAKALSEALIRDGVSESFTNLAISRMDASAAETTERLSALERKINARPPVPAVCPGPDADLLRESAAAGSRIRAAEGRLRDLRTAEGGNAH